jgi:NDP-sugar pyrophosphorylase family protein
MTVIGCHNEVKIPFGVLEMSNGRLKNIKEKPIHDVLINTGVYIMEPSVIAFIPEEGKIDMDWLLTEVAKVNKVSVYPIYRGWFDVGQWGEYLKSVEKMGVI